MLCLILHLSEEDHENMHLALGVAIGLLAKHKNDDEMADRAMRHIAALHRALAKAAITTVDES